jgi:hypothetical protein
MISTVTPLPPPPPPRGASFPSEYAQKTTRAARRPCAASETRRERLIRFMEK